jgi:hypothetical protein
MAAADAVDLAARDLLPMLARMQAWQAELADLLAAWRLRADGLQPGSVLARQAGSIEAAAQACGPAWARQWAALAPAQALAGVFDERVMLLVFGKFNAGKSSLCNLLAGRFRAQGRVVDGFHLEAGRIVQSAQPLREGATETTARLQGVCLGERLVLLDTPGLHSATADNAALTQRFIDSADAVLWLTSSTSPGQLQELDELARELARGKPLLPIVTRSDCIEEDEVDGEIVGRLCNKTAANRALQEADVRQRAHDKLVSLGVDPGLLRPAVSVSAHMARQPGPPDAVMADAGFDRLYDALLAITAPALAYRQRKPAEVLLHHLQENVQGGLQAGLVPALAALRQALHAEREALAQRQARVVQAAWRGVVPELPALLERHAGAGSVQAVCDEVARRVAAAFAQQVQAQLGDYALQPAAPVRIVLGEGVGYEALAPATDDGAGGPPALGAIGHDALHAALESAVRRQLTELAADAAQACAEALRRLDDDARRLQDWLAAEAQQLNVMAQDLRA